MCIEVMENSMVCNYLKECSNVTPLNDQVYTLDGEVTFKNFIQRISLSLIPFLFKAMEMNGNALKSGSNSSNEDLSQYTDADESMSAPTEILAEFLSALMVKDYSSALKFCKIIMQYEPNHETAKQFYPLIQGKLQIQQANQTHQLDNQIEECSSEDETSANSDENGNILDDTSDISSTGSGDQRDSEETTASYSSLEDEVVDSNTLTETHKLDTVTDSQINSDLTDDNGNLPSISTTSDSDPYSESKKVIAKLKSLLSYRANIR